MKASKLKVELNVKGIDLFKNLVELLEKHLDDLPSELQDSLKQIEEDGFNNFTAEDYHEYMFVNNLNPDDTEVSNGRQDVTKVNKILKKVYYVNMTHEILDHFSLKNKEHIIIEW